VYDVVVKVHVCFLICWWVSCFKSRRLLNKKSVAISN